MQDQEWMEDKRIVVQIETKATVDKHKFAERLDGAATKIIPITKDYQLQ